MKFQEESLNYKRKNVKQKILKHFTNHEKNFSRYLMAVLKLYLKLNSKQIIQKNSKYKPVKKYSKDYQ